MFTTGGTYQEKKEAVRGSIEINKVADFQVLDRDIFQTPAEEIGSIGVLMTMVGGKIVYEKPETHARGLKVIREGEML